MFTADYIFYKNISIYATIHSIVANIYFNISRYLIIFNFYMLHVINCTARILCKMSPKSQVRLFSSTSIRKADPLSTTAIALSVPYAAGFIANPLGGSFILLMGMGTAIFGLTTSFIAFAETNVDLGLILQRLDSIFCLYETFILFIQSGINILDTTLDNFTPEVLVYFYDSLQELITIIECLFAELNTVMVSPYVIFAGEPVVERGELILEDLRLVGNDVMVLIRNIETRLNLPENDRLPPF
jgi:hypothetical protein